MTSWRSDALCAQTDPEIFFPDTDGNPKGDAKRVCAQCPVKNPCLREAIDRREQHGIWGGLTTRERARLIRRERTAAA